jgi:hypothetical protein
VADTTLWFARRRGIAVAICASGNYLAGALWPPIVQHVVAQSGWQAAYLGMAAVCALATPLLALVLLPRLAVAVPPPAPAAPQPGAPAAARAAGAVAAPAASQARPLGLAPGTAQLLLCVAGVACCVAMSMPQVHIVSYCGDLGYGVARGAEMLSLMLAFGIASRSPARAPRCRSAGPEPRSPRGRRARRAGPCCGWASAAPAGLLAAWSGLSGLVRPRPAPPGSVPLRPASSGRGHGGTARPCRLSRSQRDGLSRWRAQ